MENLFNEMMESYCSLYLESEAGKKAMLSAMARVINNNNIETANNLLETIGGWQVKDLTYFSEKIEEILTQNGTLSVDQHKVLCNAIMEITQMLSDYNSNPVMSARAEKRINKLYEDLLSFGVEKRKMSIEEFLALDVGEEEPTKIYDTPFTPPERNIESRLIKYGYSVSQNSRLSNAARQDLLRRIIASKEVSKGYIISHLKHLIAINGKKESNHIALQKWKSDLEYVLNL